MDAYLFIYYIFRYNVKSLHQTRKSASNMVQNKGNRAVMECIVPHPLLQLGINSH